MPISARTYRLATTILLVLLAALPVQAQEWQNAAPLPAARYDMAAVALDGQIYVMGGRRERDHVSGTVHRYDPTRDRWSEVTPMEAPRSAAAAVVLNGLIYVIGGADEEDEAMHDVEVYDPSQGRWDAAAELEIGRKGHQAVVLDGRIYVVGGVDEDGRAVRDVEVYNPGEDEWNVSDDWRLSNPRVAFALVVLDDKAYVLGGLGGGSIFEPLQNSEVFSPGGGPPGVLTPPDLFQARGYLGATVAGETAYLMGGRGRRGVLNDVVRFTPSAERVSDQWRGGGPPMRHPRQRFSAVTVEGRVYVIGGQDDGDRVLASMESMVTNTRIERPDEMPDRSLTLEQNHPNPFTHSTTLSLVVGSDRSADVAVEVYDTMGRRIRSLVDGSVAPGRYDLEWDGRTDDGRLAGSGVYFCVLKGDGRRMSRMMTLIR